MSKQNKRNFQKLIDVSFASGGGGATKHYCENVIDLHSLIESILAADGQKAKALTIILALRAYSESSFTLMPFVVQTAGTFTDTIALTSGIQDVNLALCIDDVFGFQNLAVVPKIARRVPSQDGSAAGGLEYAVECSIQIPGNLLQLLNKEVETERLQLMLFGISGVFKDDAQTIAVAIYASIDFIGIRKSVILR